MALCSHSLQSSGFPPVVDHFVMQRGHGVQLKEADIRLIEAITSGDTTKAEAALHEGANINATLGSLQMTPLHLAIADGKDGLATMLLGHGADYNAADARGATPLHWATGHSSTHLVTLLIDLGAHLNAQAADLRTPLHWGVLSGRTEIVQLLLRSGADTTVRDATYRTASDLASISAHPDIVTAFEHSSAPKPSSQELQSRSRASSPPQRRG